jgi:glycerol-3-phosphate dehydrogenase
VHEEWALTVEDVLWRRTKCGLGMSPGDQARVAAYLAKVLAAA